MNDFKENLTFGASPQIFENARSLRKELTSAEELLWINLRNRRLGGHKFRRQHPIDRFIADFYCHEKRVVVEVDGGIHLNPEQKEYDENRTAEMEKWDIVVLRFTNEEVSHDVSSVLRKIRQVCDKRESF